MSLLRVSNNTADLSAPQTGGVHWPTFETCHLISNGSLYHAIKKLQANTAVVHCTNMYSVGDKTIKIKRPFPFVPERVGSVHSRTLAIRRLRFLGNVCFQRRRRISHLLVNNVHFSASNIALRRDERKGEQRFLLHSDAHCLILDSNSRGTKPAEHKLKLIITAIRYHRDSTVTLR